MDESSPRFRQDLVASATEADGVPCVDVQDPRTGTKFRFYDFEYQLALQLSGQPLNEVVAWAATAYGVELTAAGIGEFAGRLAELGFLEAAPPPSRAPRPSPAPARTPAAAPRPAATPAAAASEISDMGGTLENAEAEWMSPQAAKTAQFTPDFAMLASSPDRTPVAPGLPILESLEAAQRTPPPREPMPDLPRPAPPAAAPPPKSPPASVAVTRPREAPTVRLPPEERFPPVTRPADAPTVRLAPDERSVPVQRLADAPTVPSLPSATATGGAEKAGEGAGASSRWALELEGTLGESASKAAPSAAQTTPAPKTSAPAPGAPAPGAPAPAGIPERRQPPTPEAVVMTGFSEEGKTAAGAKSQKRPAVIAIALLLLLAAVVGYFVIARTRVPEPHAVRVRVFSPKPTAVYRWFAGRGVVVEDAPRTIGFEAGGRLAELMPPGSEFGAGEIVGRLQGSAAIETLLAHHRSRLAFYAQMRESMSAAGNGPETRQAELRLAEKRRLADETTAQLARVTLRPNEPGEVIETLAKVGAIVKAGAPIARVKGRLLHGEFSLDEEELGRATRLGFCRIEVVGLGPHASNAEPRRQNDPVADSGSPEAQNVPRFVDCASPRRAGSKLTVALPADLGLVPGQPLRLARQRYDAVFPVPAAALGGEGERRTLLVAGRTGQAERREVVVADTAEDALVSDGLRVGDDVIVDAPAGLGPGAIVVVDR